MAAVAAPVLFVTLFWFAQAEVLAEALTLSLQDLSRVLPLAVLEASLVQPVELVGKNLVDLKWKVS